MDSGTTKHLGALQEVSETLVEALKTAIFGLEKEGELSKRKDPLVEPLKTLISRCEAYLNNSDRIAIIAHSNHL